MSDYLPLSPWQLRRRAAIEKAEDERIALASVNAYWFAKAAEVRAQQESDRKREQLARAELVNHLLTPGAIGEMVMARARVDVPLFATDRKVPKKFCWMPKGCHEISASRMSGAPYQGSVRCDEAGANAVIASFHDCVRGGFRPYVDFNHNNAEAAAWVGGFSWDPAIGIMCGCDWTPMGEEAVRNQVFTSFSPTFWIDHETSRVSGLVAGQAVGGLVNSPAFRNAMPPILAAASHSMAELIRETIIKQGRPESTAATVAAAIEAGHSTKAICVLIESLP